MPVASSVELRRFGQTPVRGAIATRELQPVMTTIPDGAYDAGALDVTFDLVHP
ncbi:hypothetical protein KTE13_03020 [Burkholderia multivorans]|uniref:hypothetical protein n=1 Tax=Burkholderia multivorans TaxID=87883 RepID=UPI0021BFDEE4|nr:hypothetical protein [Burkholderia multivorans]MBU9398702.1 hypothetical protein [Burkholderia multivorans]MCA8413973.1 hypothetical protein [Burkholderia multivorans]MDI3303695.1 hypothetical protein [Burkholderia multivorans]